MLVSSLTPVPEEKVEFSYSNYSGWSSAPQKSGCYVLTAFNGRILYIGKSDNICNRIKQHLDSDEKTKQTPWGIAFWVYYKLCDSCHIYNLERGWTNEYKLKMGDLPFFNKINPPT